MHLQVHQLAKRKRMLCRLNTANQNTEYVCLPVVEIQNCLQMLLPFEAHTIDVNDNIKIHLSCPAHNKFNLHISQNSTDSNQSKLLLSAVLKPCAFSLSDSFQCTDGMHENIDFSLLRCLQTVNAEFLPLFSVCQDLSHDMQNYCADTLLPMFKNCNTQASNESLQNDTTTQTYKLGTFSIADYFVHDNSSILSKFNDCMNCTSEQKFSHKYCAKLLHLASLFCASSQADSNTKATCLFTNEMRRHVPSSHLLNMLWQQTPEKRQLTVLTKGIVPAERIYRHVLNVRVFPQDHAVVQHLASECLPMNTTIDSDVLIVHGMHNKTFACLFLSNVNLDPRMLNQVLNTFFVV